ncbi:MAG: hypothetical protein GY805_33925 [Chloroflexi bacterium]|nr:hypothetical protein [Chloroflexota bacterium]
MSHIVELEAKIKYPHLLKAVAQQLGYAVEERKGRKLLNVNLYARQRVKGVLSIQLPGWLYPVVITQNGEVKYDNFNGSWGEQALLDQLIQQYVIAVVGAHAQEQGRHVVMQQKKDGTMIMRLQVQ